MTVAVLHALKHRSTSLKFDAEPSLKGYRIQNHIAARILELHDKGELDAKLLVEECLGVIDVVEALAGKQDIQPTPHPASIERPLSPEAKSIVDKLKKTHTDVVKTEIAKTKLVPFKPKVQSPFCPEFIEFLKTGDITPLAPTGKMTREMFKGTQHYIFADVVRVNGKTVQATFFSNSTKGLVLVSPEIEVQPGKCVLINSNGVLTGYIHQIPEFASRANTFNSLAARSKG